MNKNTSCDASVVINFLRINRLDLLQRCSHSFFITDHVQDEISGCFPDQQACLEEGLSQNTLQKINVESAQEFALFADLNRSGQLGAGECAAIAVASHRGHCLAIDDNHAIKKALELPRPPAILRTQDLVLLMIQEQILETVNGFRFRRFSLLWVGGNIAKYITPHPKKRKLGSKEPKNRQKRNPLTVS